MKNILIALLVLAFRYIEAQTIVSSPYDNHWNKSYVNSKGEELSASIQEINFKNGKPKIRNVVVENQSDLTLQMEYFESGKIKQMGYFRLIFDTKDKAYAWVPDLLWTYYDIDGKLEKYTLYKNGAIIKE